MALKQLIKTQMKWREKTQRWVEIETATKIRTNVIEKKNVRNWGFLLDQYARGRVLTQVPQAYEGESLLRNRNIGDPRWLRVRFNLKFFRVF